MRTLIVAGLLVLAQAPQFPPTYGALASKLTADDHKQISHLATRMDGGSMWAVFGDGGWFTNKTWNVEVYKKPSIVKGSVRIGAVMWVAADIVSGDSSRQWRIEGVGMSAQVPLPGRTPDEITSDMDENRPFRLVGDWSADELAGVIAFIRSSPRSTHPKQGGAQVSGALPISDVRLNTDSTVRVSLRIKARVLQLVDLRPQGPGWEVTSVSVVAVD